MAYKSNISQGENITCGNFSPKKSTENGRKRDRGGKGTFTRTHARVMYF